MRILVAAAFEAGSHFANAINTVKMAEGFARLGHDVHVACRQPATGPADVAVLTREYALRAPLGWIQLRSRLLGRPLNIHAHFALQCLPHLYRLRPDLVFARNYSLPAWASRLGFATAAESHAHVDNRTAPFMAMIAATHRADFRLLVTISDRLVAHYQALGAAPEKLVVLPDAVDTLLFSPPANLPPSPYQGQGPHVVYAGHLYDYKGIPTILQAAVRLPDVQFHFLGGWPDDISRQKQAAATLGLGNVHFHGSRSHAEVPPWLWHADALLLPPSANHPSAAWTSPVKLGEYLAAGPPIVATAIPALLDWLDERECIFATPDDPESLAGAIRKALQAGQRDRLLPAARAKAAELSYERRATRILTMASARTQV